MTPADLLGRLEALNVACAKCDRRGRYRVTTLVREIGLDGNLANRLARLSADCPDRQAVSFSDRCDVRRPDLLKLANPGDGE
jgi:hypothetical protein